MSSLIDKVKDKLHAHSDTKSEQPEGTHGPHSSRTANAADPRVDSDRDNREALGRHDGSYTTGGDNYSYGSSNTKGMNTAGDTLASSAKTGPAPTTAGVHKSDMMNKADPRIDSDLDGSRNMGLRSEQATHAGTTSTTHGTGTTSTAYGTGTTGTGTTGTTFGSTGPASKTAGTHKSDTLNKADPRIDSDLDGSRNMGLRSEKATHDLGATGSTHTTGTTSTGNTFGSTGTTSTTAGTHKSDTLNKADPRIDSDLDGSRNMGLRSEKATHDLGTTRTAGTGGATTGTGFGTGMGTDTLGAGRGVDTSGTTGTYTGLSGQDRTSGLGSGTDTYSTGTSGTGRTSGLGSGTDTYSTGTSGMGRATGTGGESTARIGSISTDAYGQPAQHTTKLPGDIGSDDVTPATKHHGAGTHSTGHHGTGHHGAGNLGGGDTTTTSAYGGMGSLGGGFGTDRQATGPAPNTAGPHQSDMMNKADPRVDSDLDNSKTFGGDKTYQSDAGITAKDPTDAAQVPPSVMQKHIGEPTIEHGDRNYDRVRRHSVSHQEQHRGL